MSSSGPSVSRTPAQERALALMAERDSIDQQLQTHIAVLSSHNVNMSTRLVDGQGFPRADLDVLAIRTARVRVIELRNDRARLTDEIAQALTNVHSSGALQPTSEVKINGINGTLEPSPVGTPGLDQSRPQLLVPFARVDGVAPGSPAQQAGLQREDLILAFGSLTAQSFNGSSLQPLAPFVTSHENQLISVKIQRDSSEMSLNFTPRSGWGGRGMLGCHIVPYTAS